MRELLPLSILIATLPISAFAQDMAVAQKWAGAKVVRFHVEGVHKARDMVVLGDYEGKADVTDRVTLEYTWDVRKRALVGPLKVTDAKTDLANLKSDGTNCPPPRLNGDFEYFTLVTHGLVGDLIELKGTRTYPAANVSNYPASCSMRPIPGGTQKVVVHLGVYADPQGLAMPNMPGSPVTIAPDRKSFTMKGAEGWSWTYTPTRVE